MFEEPIRIGLIRFADVYDHMYDTNRTHDNRQRVVHDLAQAQPTEVSYDVADSSRAQSVVVVYDDKHDSSLVNAAAAGRRKFGKMVGAQSSEGDQQANRIKRKVDKHDDGDKGRKRKRRRKDGLEFDMSHQPVLVIYTASATTTEQQQQQQQQER